MATETGWSEEFIFWQLPLARALQYRHVLLRRRGLWTLEPDERPENQIAKLRAGIAEILAARNR